MEKEGGRNTQEGGKEMDISRRESGGKKRKMPLFLGLKKTEDGGARSSRGDGRAGGGAGAGGNGSDSGTSGAEAESYSGSRQKKVARLALHEHGTKGNRGKAGNCKPTQQQLHLKKSSRSCNGGGGSKMVVERASGNDREAGKRKSIQPQFLKSSRLQSSAYGEKISVAAAAAGKTAAATPASIPHSTSMLSENAHKISIALVKAANDKLRV